MYENFENDFFQQNSCWHMLYGPRNLRLRVRVPYIWREGETELDTLK